MHATWKRWVWAPPVSIRTYTGNYFEEIFAVLKILALFLDPDEGGKYICTSLYFPTGYSNVYIL